MSQLTITPDMTIAEVLRQKPEAEQIFLSIGMHCLYCPMSSRESVAQAAAVHGVVVEELLAKLNA